jgi:type VI secretion system secreted protein VgrG
MPDPFTQENRFLVINTPLGTDKLLLRSFNGYEAMSQLFSFQLDLLAEDENVDFGAIVGKNVTFSVMLGDGETGRFFNGFVSRFTHCGDDGRFAVYAAEVVPWLWFLTRTADCRIFQNMTVPDICQKIFSDFGFKDFENQLQGSYTPWEYCVQYRETACNFVMRLMEQEGIFFFFRHENGKHVMVMGDTKSAHQPCEFQPKARFEHTAGEGKVEDEDYVYDWQATEEFRTAKYTLTDYNFETPSTSLQSSVSGDQNPFEVYDYPGEYEQRSEGDRYAGIRLEEEREPHRVISGASDCRGFEVGGKFDLSEHSRRDQNGTYVITSLTHGADGGQPDTTEGGGVSYTNNFTCIPAATVFRPARVTPKPIVQGTQTAVVVGPAGEEIYVDKYGRVKIQFFWDREGHFDEKSSCWVRVSQNWAGKRWGIAFWPRIGQEVIVDFLEGDPDRPIIVGRVYNADQMPPYTLPDEKTKSTVKTFSSKGGGGFNEIRFEDKKGKEQIFINAERNEDVRVKENAFETIGASRNLIVGGDQLEDVAGDKHLHVKGNLNEKVDGTVSLQAGGELQVKVAQKHALDAGIEIHLKAGTNFVIESGTTLTLKVGGNFININPGGIFIKGAMVFINSGGSAGSGAGASPEDPKKPAEADKADPGEKSTPPQPVSVQRSTFQLSPVSVVLKQAAESGTPFCDI